MKKVRSIGIIGGGTAGYLAALTLKKAFPNYIINMVVSADIPPIGVGESTTPKLLKLLHHDLDFDIAEFMQSVKPTIKLGGRFFWGSNKQSYYNNAFGYINPLAGYHLEDDINVNSFNSFLMDQNKVFILKNNKNEEYLTINPPHSFTYHLDNHTFIKYLQSKSKERGILTHIATVKDISLAENGELESVKTNCGKTFDFDFYIDCSGFKSLLLDQTLHSPYQSFKNNLLTDSAITAEVNHKGIIKPYTTSTNMLNGWQWTIPMHTHDHIGYVYSSSHCSEENAKKELESKYQNIKLLNTLKFKSGRHKEAIKNNVAAVGNSYGFIEALHSTSLHMTISNIYATIFHLKLLEQGDDRSDSINDELGKIWDSLRDFISIHFKYNQRVKSNFWKDCNNYIDHSNFEYLVEAFQSKGILARNKVSDKTLREMNRHMIFGLFSFDFMMEVLGIQGFKNSNLNEAELQEARKTIQKWKLLSENALDHKSALNLILDKEIELEISFKKESFLELDFDYESFKSIFKRIR